MSDNQAATPTFCPSCGHAMNPDAAFCEKCGSQANSSLQSAAPVAEPQLLDSNGNKLSERSGLKSVRRGKWWIFVVVVGLMVIGSAAIILKASRKLDTAGIHSAPEKEAVVEEDCSRGCGPESLPYVKYAHGKDPTPFKLPELDKQIRALLGTDYDNFALTLSSTNFLDTTARSVEPGASEVSSDYIWTITGHGCEPHACGGSTAVLAVNLLDGTLIAAGLNETVYGLGSIEALPQGMKDWVAGRPNIVFKTTYITAVRNGVLPSPHNITTIGKAFEATFTHWKWESHESAKDARFVEFMGRLKPETYKKSFDVLPTLCKIVPSPICSATEEEFATVIIRFTFSANEETFQLAVDPKPWKYMNQFQNSDIAPAAGLPLVDEKKILDYIYY